MRLHSYMSSNPQMSDAPQRPIASRYHALADTASDWVAVYCCNALGVIQFYNSRAAELWGRYPAFGDTDERFCGSHMLYRIDGSVIPHDQCPMADVLAGKVSGIWDAEVQIQRPDGSRVVVIVNVAPALDDDGVMVGACSSFSEVTQRMAANGQHATA